MSLLDVQIQEYGLEDDQDFARHFLGYFKTEYDEVNVYMNITTKLVNDDLGSELKFVELPIESVNLFKVLYWLQFKVLIYF